MSLDDLGGPISYGEAIAYVVELRKEFGSHLNTALNGFRWATSMQEIVGIIHAEWYMNVHRDEKKRPEPFDLPKPFGAAEADNADVSDAERDALRESLKSRSAFRS